MRLRHIEVLNALMVTGTVTATARALHVTQPAVTHALASLERELGYALFERVGGRLRPTPEGRMLGQESEALMRQFSAFRDLAGRMQAGERASVLHIVAAPILCVALLPAAIADFAAKGSSAVALESRLTADAIETLESGKAELSVGFSVAARPALLDLPIGELPAMCLAPKGEIGKSRIRASDLASREVLIAEPIDPLSRALWDACVDAGLHPSRHYRIQSPQAIAGLVAEGAGVAVVDAFTATLADRRRVDALPMDVGFGYPVVVSRRRATPLSDDGENMIGSLRTVFERLAAPGPKASASLRSRQAPRQR